MLDIFDIIWFTNIYYNTNLFLMLLSCVYLFFTLTIVESKPDLSSKNLSNTSKWAKWHKNVLFKTELWTMKKAQNIHRNNIEKNSQKNSNETLFNIQYKFNFLDEHCSDYLHWKWTALFLMDTPANLFQAVDLSKTTIRAHFSTCRRKFSAQIKDSCVNMSQTIKILLFIIFIWK